MSKFKTDKKAKELRRELEILKAQLKLEKDTDYSNNSILSNSNNYDSSEGKKLKEIMIDSKYVRKDLMKTFILAISAFLIIFTLWYKG